MEVGRVFVLSTTSWRARRSGGCEDGELESAAERSTESKDGIKARVYLDKGGDLARELEDVGGGAEDVGGGAEDVGDWVL